MPVALLALAIGAFGIGATEFAMMGVLPAVAHGMHVSIPRAGYLITGYALGVVVGAPLITALADAGPVGLTAAVLALAGLGLALVSGRLDRAPSPAST
ncbi:hypothetical protein [Streptomyces silvisoli]|uniref:hypothetical protein n=1 Tax=Streptomyces silvisoli TaxID=3034235 RepID=UPI003704967A